MTVKGLMDDQTGVLLIASPKPCPNHYATLHNCATEYCGSFVSVLLLMLSLLLSLYHYHNLLNFVCRVFVNRSLLMKKIKFFGFDMDYTLAGE